MGIIFEKYRSGVNLGGWISQSKYEKEHIAEFVTKADIDRIAAWGVDHIRLPIDYPVLEDDTNPFHYLEEGFDVIHRLVDWCKSASLNVVLDLHKAPGYSFNNKAQDNVFFTDKTAQKRFVSLWQEFAKRFKNEGDNVIFEIINEIVDPHGETWNDIAREAITAIREIDQSRYILLGGPFYNAVKGLATLEIYDDQRVLYNFHFYEPFLFTHQQASWTHLKNMTDYQPYPGKVVDQAEEKSGATVYDIAFLEKMLAPAIKFAKRHNKQLYCGEYGAIENANLECRVNYIRDVNQLLDKYGIGRAVWTYKKMSFTSIDEQGNPVCDRLVKALAV